MQTSTDRKWKYFRSNLYFDFDYTSLEDVKKQVDRLISNGIDPRSQIRIEEDYDMMEVNLYEYRKETDTEAEQRIEREDRLKSEREDYDFKAYQELKKKFEGK